MRRTRLMAVVVTVLSLVAACGSSDEGAGTKAGLDAVTVTGEIGSQPNISFSDVVSVEKSQTKVLITGDGAEIAEGDRVRAHLSVADGFSKSLVYSTYADGGAAQVLDVKEASLAKGLYASIIGQKIGSRVVTVAGPADAFGDQGNPGIGVGNTDSVVFIVDIIAVVTLEPSGAPATPALWAPDVVMTDDVPTALDFAGTPKPSKKLAITYVIKGDGDPVKPGQTVTVNYLGQVYGADAPFDASFARGEPFDVVNIGKAQVVEGWNKALVGLPVGSRVIVAIPPLLGYGKDGNPAAKIKGTDTMYFLIDVLYVA